MALLEQGAATGCCGRSEKHGITDPQAIAWNHFHLVGEIPLFNEVETAAGLCCALPPG